MAKGGQVKDDSAEAGPPWMLQGPYLSRSNMLGAKPIRVGDYSGSFMKRAARGVVWGSCDRFCRSPWRLVLVAATGSVAWSPIRTATAVQSQESRIR
jgi:hypothetical protein